jgi:uncharacterized protein YjiS (DUF1127 family)
MRNSTDSDNLATREEAAPFGVIAFRDAPAILLGRGPAGNDATCEDPPPPKDKIDSWARRAGAAIGFDYPGVKSTDLVMRPSSYDLHWEARALRSFALGEVIIAMIRSVVAVVRGVYAHLQQRRQARAIEDALRELDDHTLRDLGFDRGEIASVAAEATGDAERTRVRVLLMSHGLPR